MSDTIISVENLGKAYRIGLKEEIPDTFVGALQSWIKAPLTNFTKLRRLNTFSDNGDGDSDDIIWALKDVSFNVKEGEVVGIIGRNGAGKSTLLKILSRITEPTTGRADIHGRVSSLFEVGTGFHPELTGRENVYMNGTILGMRKKKIDRKFDEIVDFSGIEKFLDTPIKRYSTGMNVRLAFAVAAHIEPEILIINEVLAVGDAEFQKKCLGKMQDVARGGRTVLFVSHNMGAIESLCNKGILIDSGKISCHGSQQDAIRKYCQQNDQGTQHGLMQTVSSENEREVHIISAQITSNNSYSSAGYQMGAPLEIRVDCKSNHTLTHPELGIGIDNSMGQRITTLHSSLEQHNTVKHNHTSDTFSFICRIDGIVLAPDEYSVKLSLEGDGDPLHIIDPALRFRILFSSDYGKGGRLHRGLIFCNQTWKIGKVDTHETT
jgi:lipopolysaccharide transport system ATP-binding protein